MIEKREIKRLVGRCVRRERCRRDLTREQLARRAHIEITTLLDIENGNAAPNVITLVKICVALKIELIDLFDHFELRKMMKREIEK